MTLSPLACRNRGCTHPKCRDAKNSYETNRRRQIGYGRWEPYVDAEPARRHVQWLVSQGVPLTRLVPIYPTVAVLVYGRPAIGQPPTAKMRRGPAEALLAVRPTWDMLGRWARVDASGTRRRIQALAALGWSLRAQSRHLRASPTRCERALREDTVTVEVARRVRDLYDELSMVRPEGTYAGITRRQAARRGWLPPLAWDDDLLDVPEAELQAELERRVDAMDSVELWRCHEAWRQGDPTPLMGVAGREYRRRKKERAKERQRLAA